MSYKQRAPFLVTTILLGLLSGCGGSNPATEQSVTSRPALAVAKASNEHWMANIWNSISHRRLDQILIPGTHDSGTFRMASVTGSVTGRTQIGNFATQLADGIRYFDIRLAERAHTGCADDTVWWFVHGSLDTETRFNSALDHIKSFLDKPGNEKEILILDLQEINLKYDDDRSRDNLFELIQRKLSPHLAKSGWNEKTLKQLVDAGERVVVLVGNAAEKKNLEVNYQPYCGSFDKNNFTTRGSALISAYEYDDPLDWARDVKSRIIDPQLNYDAAMAANSSIKNKARYLDYKNATRQKKLRVIQVVSRPSKNWYANSVMNAPSTRSPDWWLYFPTDLLTFASYRINGRMNYEYNEVEALDWNVLGFSAKTDFPSFLTSSGKCASGWLGMRLRMSLEGNPDWNPANIVIVDNYAPPQHTEENQNSSIDTRFDWVLPDYRDNKWVKDKSGSYVNMFVALNQMELGNQRLANASIPADGTCLQ